MCRRGLPTALLHGGVLGGVLLGCAYVRAVGTHYPLARVMWPQHSLACAVQGGYSDFIVVKESFVLRIPDSLPLDATAPLLCAGITTYRCMGCER